jgi:DNA-binding response OmpR family regulator
MLDQPIIAEAIDFTLNHGLFDLRTTNTAHEAASLIQNWRPHLAIIDMDLTNAANLNQLGLRGDPLEFGLPVIGLTRRGDLRTKLDAFEQGVDDIITIPFSPDELLARTMALARRTYGVAPKFKPVITIGEIEIDILNREVRTGESVIHLTGLEQNLLYLLAANAGRVISRTEILDSLWGSDYVAESNVVDRHIRALRAKLQNDWRRPRFIGTVSGEGYRFIPTFTKS